MNYICKYKIKNHLGQELEETSDIIQAKTAYEAKTKLAYIKPLSYDIKTFLTVETDSINSQFIAEIKDLLALMVARDCRNERYVLEFSDKWAEKLEIE